MSFFRSSFSIRKTKGRKVVSRSPLKLAAEDLARELGPQIQAIDARVGNQKMAFDATRGEWLAGMFVSFLIERSLPISFLLHRRSS